MYSGLSVNLESNAVERSTVDALQNDVICDHSPHIVSTRSTTDRQTDAQTNAMTTQCYDSFVQS